MEASETLEATVAPTGSKSSTPAAKESAPETVATTPEAPKVKTKEKESTDHIVELRVAIWNSKPQVLEGAKVTLSPMPNAMGTIIYGTTEEDMKKMAFINEGYLKDFRISLTHKTTKYNMNDTEGLFKYNFLRSHSWVANSIKDVTERTVYVLFDEVTEARDLNQKFDVVLTAYKYIAEMSQSEKAKFLSLYGVNTHHISPELIMNQLRLQADDNPELFVSRFEDSNKSHKEFLAALVEFRIVRKDKEAYLYGEVPLGHNLELTIEYLKDPAKQDTKLILMRALEEAEAR